MHDLYTTVVRHLKNQRDSAAAIGLWDDIWAAYVKGGTEGVDEFIDQIIKRPDIDDEEQS